MYLWPELRSDDVLLIILKGVCDHSSFSASGFRVSFFSHRIGVGVSAKCPDPDECLLNVFKGRSFFIIACNVGHSKNSVDKTMQRRFLAASANTETPPRSLMKIFSFHVLRRSLCCISLYY